MAWPPTPEGQGGDIWGLRKKRKKEKKKNGMEKAMAGMQTCLTDKANCTVLKNLASRLVPSPLPPPLWVAGIHAVLEKISTQVSAMILPQVHLRKPCYDFYFLQTTKFARLLGQPGGR